MIKSVTVDSCPSDYRSARAAFLAAAEAARVGTLTRVHPAATGRDGRPLFLDTVSLGARDAKHVLLVLAGTGGVDGYFGSAVETALLSAEITVPANTRLVLLHALNPWGFAWGRSVNEDNVRIDRNFVRFDPMPENPLYAGLADALCLKDMSPETLAVADAKIDAFVAAHGEEGLQQMLLAGQYSHPDGLFYGGDRPSWSRRMLTDVFREELRGAEDVVTLDLRTGFGPFGQSILISADGPESEGYALARDIWQGAHLESADAGPLRHLASGPQGGMGADIAAMCPRGVLMTLMAGTRPFGDILRLLRKDNWCVRAGLDNEASLRVSDEVRAMYCPDARGWMAAASQAASMAILTALAALAG